VRKNGKWSINEAKCQK
jgi:hypothetical protein